jgi:hypothetical protein
MTAQRLRLACRSAIISASAVAAVIAGLAVPACSSKSLVELDVTSGDVAYTNVTLRLTASSGGATVKKDLPSVNIALAPALPVGIYLPSDLSGSVLVVAEVIQGSCAIATGQATVPDVSAGKTAGPKSLVVFAESCVPVQVGMGGATGSGSGGATGTGAGGFINTGAGGVTGTGSGGVTGTGSGGITGTGVGGFINTGSGGVTGTGSGGVTGTGSGGVTGTGVGGFINTGSGGTTSTGCGALIDDMESGTGNICTGDGRVGHWYTYADSLTGTIITPPTTQIPALPELLSTPRGSSTRAMHFHGTASSYAGIGCVLNNATIGATPSTVNGSAYSGIQMYVRGTGTSARLIVQTSDTEADTYGGLCKSATVSCAGNYATISMTSDWSLIQVPFTYFNYGSATFNKANLWSIEMNPASLISTFDFWIDDLSFY